VAITARQWTLDASRDDIDMTMFGDANKVTFKDLPNFTGDFEGVFDDGETTVFAASESDAAVRMYLYPDHTNLAGRYWYGTAHVDYSIDTQVDDKVMVSGTWVAASSWART
jgi:hypothetical protein